ncbi:MAG: hypothetical protein RJA70_1436 [Pseudomonadota bacterium]|jgi:bilirubin oxidase
MKHGSDAPVTTPTTPDAFTPIPVLPEATVERKLKLEESMAMSGGHGAGHGASATGMGPVFSINGQVYPDATPLAASLETIEEWSIVNATEMDHPFHLHGFRFQVVSVDGAAPGVVAWRDSIVTSLSTLSVE